MKDNLKLYGGEKFIRPAPYRWERIQAVSQKFENIRFIGKFLATCGGRRLPIKMRQF